MDVTNIHQAKTNLSKLIAQAQAGEEVVIAKAGKPVVRLVPVVKEVKQKRQPGLLKGQIWMSADFNDEDEEINKMFYDGDIFP